MYAHDLREQETRRLRRGLHGRRERTQAGLAQRPFTAWGLSAGQADLRELPRPPRE